MASRPNYVALVILSQLILLKEHRAKAKEITSTFFTLRVGRCRSETGKLSKLVATVTSLIVVSLVRWSGGQLSVVS